MKHENHGAIDNAQLKSIVERIEKLNEDMASIAVFSGRVGAVKSKVMGIADNCCAPSTRPHSSALPSKRNLQRSKICRL